MDDTNSAGIMVPVRFVRREELEGPFDGLFYLRGRGSSDLPAAPTAADDRSTKLLLKLKEVAAADRFSAGDECAICLRGFRAEETVRAMPACAHAFHHHCISEWLRRNPISPLCRRGLPEDEEDDDVDWEGGAIICDWEEEEDDDDDEDLEDGEIICDWEEEEVDYSDERRTRRRIASSDDIGST